MEYSQKKMLEDVKAIFASYLKARGLRQTSERLAILKEIYSRNDHFDAESLYVHMKNQNYRISRATIYNTLELLVACDLVARHQFGKNIARYEKSYGYKQHDHMICTACSKVVEFCDPRIYQIQSMMGDLLHFQVTHHTLNLFGICKDCRGAEKMPARPSVKTDQFVRKPVTK